MAQRVNRKLDEMAGEQKLVLITGDLHFQTKKQNMMLPDESGKMALFSYVPMGAMIATESVLAIHFRYFSGEMHNKILKKVPMISMNKEMSFREDDVLVEIDVSEAHALGK